MMSSSLHDTAQMHDVEYYRSAKELNTKRYKLLFILRIAHKFY